MGIKKAGVETPADSQKKPYATIKLIYVEIRNFRLLCHKN